MIHHHITKYGQDGMWYAEAWLQINIFGLCFCFSKRKMKLGEMQVQGGEHYEI